MSLDGAYGFVYCGAVDVGIGAFIVENGAIRGRDSGGLTYSGTIQENADKTITSKIIYRIAAGGMLVQACTAKHPVRQSYRADFSTAVRRREAFRDGNAAFHVTIRRLPANSAPPYALGSN